MCRYVSHSIALSGNFSQSLGMLPRDKRFIRGHTHKYINKFLRPIFIVISSCTNMIICSYLSAQHSAKPPSCTAAFAGGISIANKPPTPPVQSQGQHSNSSNWSHVQPSRPVQSGYVQPPQYNQQSMYPPSSYSSEPANVVNQNQFQPQQVRLM